MAGDVYSEPPHAGRGGWTWYTGAAGWMYRAGRRVDPGLPAARDRAARGSLHPARLAAVRDRHFRYHSARYRLAVENPRGAMRGVTSIPLDGGPVEGREIPLADDGREHRIAVMLG